MILKDVIHYYIGQKALYSSPRGTDEKTYTLRPTNIEEAIEFSDKPILRPLTDLKYNEITDIWMLIFNSTFNLIDNNIKQFSDKVFYLRNDNNNQELIIRVDGTIKATSDYHPKHFNPLIIYNYLFSKGFDLFSLIDSEQAVNINQL